MIYKRAVAKLRAQDWGAIVIELGIVILGVYIGTWVANRNQEAVERADTIRLLNQFKPEIQWQQRQFDAIKTYMAITGNYARIAQAGWRGDPAVSDTAFVIAAYQASQITGSAVNTQSWSSMFGAGQVQNIADPALRNQLIRVLSLDSSTTDYRQLESDYRKDVRHVIPGVIQDAIRSQCGDRYLESDGTTPLLPPKCGLTLPVAAAHDAAAALRAHPELAHELDWHRALIASMLSQYAGYVQNLRTLEGPIDDATAGPRR